MSSKKRRDSFPEFSNKNISMKADELIENLSKLKVTPSNDDELKKRDLTEKLMTLNDLYIKKRISYQDYKKQLDQLNKMRDAEAFKK